MCWVLFAPKLLDFEFWYFLVRKHKLEILRKCGFWLTDIYISKLLSDWLTDCRDGSQVHTGCVRQQANAQADCEVNSRCLCRDWRPHLLTSSPKKIKGIRGQKKLFFYRNWNWADFKTPYKGRFPPPEKKNRRFFGEAYVFFFIKSSIFGFMR